MDFRQIATDAAIKAGDHILRLREKLSLDQFVLGEDYKEGVRSLKARADTESEAMILKSLQKYFPTHAYLSEERGYESSYKSPEYTWIIDPLHDTIAYVRGNWSEFSIVIALAMKKKIILGIIYQPVLKRLYIGMEGKGATLNGKPIYVSSIQNSADSNMSIQHNALRYGDINIIVQLAHDVRRLYALGSAMFGELALGSVDIVLSYKQPLYDYAAASILVKEAGGIMSQLDGSPVPIVFDTIRRCNLVATNRLLHKFILDKLKSDHS